MLSATLMMLTGCQSEPERPAAESPAPPAVTMNSTEPAATPTPPPPPTAENSVPSQEVPPNSVEEEAPAAGESGLTREFLMHQKFVLVQVNEADYVGPGELPIPTLEFGDDFLVSGRICNNYRGSGELRDDVLSVRAVASTRMLCPDTNLNQLETRFFQMLENGAGLSMDGDRLTLKQGDNSLVFKAQSGS
jgi:heat shock protein HslJ